MKDKKKSRPKINHKKNKNKNKNNNNKIEVTGQINQKHTEWFDWIKKGDTIGQIL